MNNKKVIFAFFAAIFVPCMIFSAGADKNGIEDSLGIIRYGIYVGSNSGGENTQRLLYAETDAVSFQKTMTEIGGIPASNGILLLDPTKSDLDDAMASVSKMINQNKIRSKRSEFVFYYSGHSDENSLLLGNTSYGYSELKAAISNIPSDVHVVILDSCYSGNFIRIKGGQRKKPFLMDDSSVVKGHAYLSSSSSQEFAQESAEIGSSFFTNALLTGLRGAADSSGDKKITLNELYSYAFSETLSKTENSGVGPQHPNYNITLVGSGDLVLSDISNSDSMVLLSADLNGQVFIRDRNGKLISEINKVSDVPVYLALEKGDYSATVIQKKATLQGNFSITNGKVYELSEKSFRQIATASNRLRGTENGGETDSEGGEGRESGAERSNGKIAFNLSQEEKYVPVEFSFLTNEFSREDEKRIVTPFALSILYSKVYRVDGAMIGIGVQKADYVRFAQIAGIGNYTNEFNGAQIAGIYNTTHDAQGLQASGIYNTVQDMHGIQAAGIFNSAKEIHGIQAAGIVNKADEVKGIQGSGIVNMAGKMKGIQGSGVVNIANDIHGVQGSGGVNIANKTVGIQFSGGVNIAKEVHGVQLGFVNIAKEIHGLQIGLLNISRNGVFELGSSFTSNRNMRFTFNSGSRYLYGILGCSISGNFMFDDYDGKQQFNAVYGLGTRLKKGKFNFDFEIIRIAEDESSEEDEDGDDDYSVSFTSLFVPTLRLSAGFTPVKHFNIFAGCSFSFDYGESADVYENLEKNLIIYCKDDFKIFPEIDLGLRFTIN